MELVIALNQKIFNKKEDILLLREAIRYDVKADEVIEALKKFENITSSNRLDALMSIYSLLLKGLLKIKFGTSLIRLVV